MTNQKIIEIDSTFLKEYLSKIGKLEDNKKISGGEAFIAVAIAKNGINIWAGLFSDKKSPYSSVKLPEITEDSFDGMIKAFAYLVFVELDEIFHIYNSPFQDKMVKDALAPLIAETTKEKIAKIAGEAIGGEDIILYFSECEKLIAGNRRNAKTPEEEIVQKYLFGARIMFDNMPDSAPKKDKETEEFLLEIYKQNMINFVSREDKNQSNELSSEEKQHLKDWVAKIEAGEISQVKDLIANCNNAFQFAKTHSVYLKDWEKTKQRMEENLKNGVLPPGVSANLHRAIIDATDKIIQKKLEMVRNAFQEKFGESIYNYLGSDGKAKKLFGIFG